MEQRRDLLVERVEILAKLAVIKVRLAEAGTARLALVDERARLRAALVDVHNRLSAKPRKPNWR
jgi:hypothetical protein